MTAPSVSWGSNTTHNFVAGNPSGPSSSGLFKSSSTQSPTGNLFGSSTTPLPRENFLGSYAPAPTGFFSSLAPPTAPNTSITTLFGTNIAASSKLQQHVLPQQQIPAQAAMQAKMSAERVVENDRIKNKLDIIHRTYSGNIIVHENAEKSATFCFIVYNDLSPEEIQVRMIHGMTTGYSEQLHHHSAHIKRNNNPQLHQHLSIFRPPRPNQICGKDWENALLSNPDPNKYVPAPLIGSVAIQARVANQQQRANEYAKKTTEINKVLEFIWKRESLARQDLTERKCQYENLRRRLLDLMKKVEVARSLNQRFQPDEHRCFNEIAKLLNLLEQLRVAFATLQNQSKTQIISGRSESHTMSTAGNHSDTIIRDSIGLNKEELLRVLHEQRHKLNVLTQTSKRDIRDLSLIAKEIVN